MRLSELYPSLTTSEREELASKVRMSPGYLWQIATRWKGKTASIGLIQRLHAADERLTLVDLVAEFTEPAPVPPYGPRHAKGADQEPSNV